MNHWIIFALTPLILSIGIIPAIPFGDADSTIPSAKSNLDNAFTAATFAHKYKDMQYAGKTVSVVIKVVGESENTDPAKRAKEIRYLQNPVLKFLSFSNAVNVVSNQEKNEITAQIDSGWIPILEKRGDVISVIVLKTSTGKTYDLACTEGLELVLRTSDNSPACLKPSSVEKLIQRGWAKEIVGQ